MFEELMRRRQGMGGQMGAVADAGGQMQTMSAPLPPVAPAPAAGAPTDWRSAMMDWRGDKPRWGGGEGWDDRGAFRDARQDWRGMRPDRDMFGQPAAPAVTPLPAVVPAPVAPVAPVVAAPAVAPAPPANPMMALMQALQQRQPGANPQDLIAQLMQGIFGGGQQMGAPTTRPLPNFIAQTLGR